MIFKYTEYRAFLLSYFGDKSRRKGLKSSAAKFLGCHTTLISQVLHGQIILNLEQADKLNKFIGHNEEEAHYFILLVQKARAGTKSLESYFQNQIEQILKLRKVLKKRIGKADSIAAEDELRYYSAWQFSAIHVCLSIPEYNNPASISQLLSIPISNVRATLDFLVRTGLANVADGVFSIGSKHIHLGVDSPQIRNHHLNWRIKTIQSLDKNFKNNLHYSSAVTLSQEDANTIKELLIQSLKTVNKVIQSSKEEEIYCLNFDFFNLAANERNNF